ncbi:glycosyl transferase [Microbispora rosea subsp. aerata]|nr:glycosyltransferase [Microbispora rosea]GGO00460.1 glycosyl transferase [Microbispora rosea subsp. aerata]GIH56818.1 glycosyl transferase [Microbispora rosea subsp. aerata]GLJ84302.1 glycosyl transferase [Microbispora rosea subsp. aerata]
MRVLLSTIGTRGEVQPMVALAMALRDLGQEARLCVPPDFRDWAEGLGFPVVPIGPELRPTASAAPRAQTPPTPEQRRLMIEGTVAVQFATIPAAAEGCDVIVAGGAMSMAAHSVAERLRIGYVYVSYCPVTLPSPHHAPVPVWGQAPSDAAGDNRALWAEDARHWNDTVGAALNAHRAAAGLAPVADMRGHMFTDRPWLAADPTLGPWLEPADIDVVQTGAWILPDRRPLPAELEKFLDDGEPPVCVGFGSVRAPRDVARATVDAARALGRRVIVLRGWAGLAPADDGSDCLTIDEVNQQALFRRVAAVVHHGGAGTTTAAALAGAPQVVVPQHYDQHYWARRVGDLGIGIAHPSAAPTAESLAAALGKALDPGVAARAAAVANEVRTDGAMAAARRLIAAAG